MTKMNIWIINHYAVAPGSSGGTRHYDLAKELIKQGHRVTIFASSVDYQLRQDIHINDPKVKLKEETFDGVRFVWIKTQPYKKNDWRRIANMVSFSVSLYRQYHKLDDRPDIVIGSLVHPLAALIGYKIAQKYQCTFYFEERDLWPQTLIDLGKVSKKNPIVLLLSQIELFLYKKADRVIVLFDKAVDYVGSRGIDTDKVLYLPNGVDLSRYDNQDSELALSPQLKRVFAELEGKFIAVYIGAHGLANNLDDVLDAAGRLVQNDDLHFLLVGDGPEKERLEKRKVTEKLSNTTFWPAVPKEYIPFILAKCQVGLLPLKDSPVFKWGISPNKLFDYMASALPVLLLANLDDTVISRSGGGYVIKADFSAQLAQHLVDLALDRDKASTLGQKGRVYLEEHHTWEKLSAKLLKVMEQGTATEVDEIRNDN